MWAVRKSSGTTHRYWYHRKPKQPRSLSPVYLPADIWLLLPPYLIQTDIRALAGACVTLRMIFKPLIAFKVTIMHDDPPQHALRKVLVVTRTSTILNSVVEVKIGRSFITSKGVGGSYKIPYLLTPALLALVNAFPAMRQLHTIQLNHIILSKMHLYTILSSPYLIHLTLNTVQLPKISTFPPPKLRKLILTRMSSWETVQPLISQLATSLEYLELQGCTFLPLSQLQLPPFPCLQELRHHQHCTRSTFPDKIQLNEFLRIGSQVTHLHVTGHVHDEPIAACQRSLRYLSTDAWMLSERILGTEPFPRLMHLSLKFSRFSDTLNRLHAHSPFVCDYFPRITSLHLDVPWIIRNDAILMARSQHNVQTLKLIFNTSYGIEYETPRSHSCLPLEASNDDQLHPAILPFALQTLELEVPQLYGEPERSAMLCSQWVFGHVVPFVTDLGGTGLKSIGLKISSIRVRPRSATVEREQVLQRQWAKVSNDGWQILE